jgi:hypothetical protein
VPRVVTFFDSGITASNPPFVGGNFPVKFFMLPGADLSGRLCGHCTWKHIKALVFCKSKSSSSLKDYTHTLCFSPTRMPACDICGEDVKSLPQHKNELHSIPPPIEIDGVLTEIKRDGDDDALGCPFSNCAHRYTRRSGFTRHVKSHASQPATPLHGKRSFGSSLESLSDKARKKAKTTLDRLRSVIKSNFHFCLLDPLLTQYSQKRSPACLINLRPRHRTIFPRRHLPPAPSPRRHALLAAMSRNLVVMVGHRISTTNLY